jgi:hypothetical protein
MLLEVEQVRLMLELIISASLLAAPQPIHLETWFSEDDFPDSVMDQEKTAFRPVTQTLVDAHGKIVGCRLETPSSSPEINGLACGIIMKRGQFQPARWSDGTAVAGVYRAAIGFAMEGDTLPAADDVELEVASLPDGKKKTQVHVAYAVDAQGKIVDCKEEPSTDKGSKPANPALVSIACQTISADWKPFTVLGEDGKKTRSVQDATVAFKVANTRR